MVRVKGCDGEHPPVGFGLTVAVERDAPSADDFRVSEDGKRVGFLVGDEKPPLVDHGNKDSLIRLDAKGSVPALADVRRSPRQEVAPPEAGVVPTGLDRDGNNTAGAHFDLSGPLLGGHGDDGGREFPRLCIEAEPSQAIKLLGRWRGRGRSLGGDGGGDGSDDNHGFVLCGSKAGGRFPPFGWGYTVGVSLEVIYPARFCLMNSARGNVMWAPKGGHVHAARRRSSLRRCGGTR